MEVFGNEKTSNKVTKLAMAENCTQQLNFICWFIIIQFTTPVMFVFLKNIARTFLMF